MKGLLPTPEEARTNIKISVFLYVPLLVAGLLNWIPMWVPFMVALFALVNVPIARQTKRQVKP